MPHNMWYASYLHCRTGHSRSGDGLKKVTSWNALLVHEHIIQFSASNCGDPKLAVAVAANAGYTTAAHVAHATLEAIAYQTRDVLEAMRKDADHLELSKLRVDGGASANKLLMQMQVG